MPDFPKRRSKHKDIDYDGWDDCILHSEARSDIETKESKTDRSIVKSSDTDFLDQKPWNHCSDHETTSTSESWDHRLTHTLDPIQCIGIDCWKSSPNSPWKSMRNYSPTKGLIQIWNETWEIEYGSKKWEYERSIHRTIIADVFTEGKYSLEKLERIHICI